MSETRIVFLKISAMFLVILVGWLARHRGYLKDEFTGLLSRLVVDVAFPALVFTQMLRTVDFTALRQGWFCPLLCGLLFVVAYGVGVLLAPLFSSQSRRNTFLFLVTIPNWIFLPLPIAQALYGDNGVRTVLLFNVGAQLTLWSFGVWILHGTIRQALRSLGTNIGLWATALGIVLALLFPGARGLETLDGASASVGTLVGGALIQAMAMVGSLTIPLSLFVIGAQLGALSFVPHQLPRILWGVVTVRLVLAPLATVGLLAAMAKAGFPIPEPTRQIAYLIAAMPVAISCSVMAERFEGDATLAAQGIFYSTFFSLLTVPGLFLLIQHAGVLNS